MSGSYTNIYHLYTRSEDDSERMSSQKASKLHSTASYPGALKNKKIYELKIT